MDSTSHFIRQLLQCPAVLVSVYETRGSVPREAGAWMAVFATEVVGTIGGGRLELDAITHGRAVLRGERSADVELYKLGPSLGQCCGGEVRLRYEVCSARDSVALLERLKVPLTPVALFGGGHVGRALVQVLATLPMQVLWVDSRDEIFPSDLPSNVVTEHSDPVQAAVAHLAPFSQVLVMSFSHAEDLDIVAACLSRQRAQGDLPFVGLIGSRTKWASFRQRLVARGFDGAELSHITCPIGLPGIKDKRPEVIAVSVAAQLLQVGQGANTPN